MFEKYLNDLRLVRTTVSALDPFSFAHLKSVADSKRPIGTCSGWSIWTAGANEKLIGLAWPWAFIEYGVPAIEPLRIQSNLFVLADDRTPLSEYRSFAVLLELINNLKWHMHAREACGEPYQ